MFDVLHRRARFAVAIAIVLASACRAAPPTAAKGPAVATTTHADDEGVFFTFEGPKNASYAFAETERQADASGRARFGVRYADLPDDSGTLAVVMRWEDSGPHEARLAVFYTREKTEPGVSFVAEPRARGENPEVFPEVDAECSGACSGTATFEDGTADLEVTATTGCTVRAGGETQRFAAVPTWDDSGRLHRLPMRFRVSVVDAVNEGRLPDVLVKPIDVPGTLECPGATPKPFTLTFGPGAAVTAVRGRYHIIVPRDGHGQRNALVIHGALLMEGLDPSNELVRWYGAPATVDDVGIIGKIKEFPRGTNETCTVSGATFAIERRDLGIELFDRDAKRFADTVISAPAADCAALAKVAPTRDAEGHERRIVRPQGAAIDAFVKAYVRP